jgi:hypothetical protein
MTPPAASAAAPAIAPRRTTSPRRAPATRRPRRVSGPASPARGRAGSIRHQTRGWFGPARAVGLAEAVATHRLLDRLIRGRLWIGVIAFALIGIVTMQLVLLKLNAGIGRSLVRETLLQRENATLSAENSEVAAGEQVEAQAEHAGMELIPEGALRFLTAHPASDISKAAAALSAPIAATSTTGGEATASDTSTSGESSASSTTSTGEAAASTTSTGEASTQTATGTEATATPAQATTPAASSPATTAEVPASGAGTASTADGASEAATPSTATPSATVAAGGGTPGG